MSNSHLTKDKIFKSNWVPWKYKFFGLIKLDTLKYFKNFFATFFNFLFPIIWILISWSIINDGRIPHDLIHQTWQTYFVSATYFGTISMAIVTTTVFYGMDRIGKRSKILASLGISKKMLMIERTVFTSILFFLVLMIEMFVGNFGLGAFISPSEYIYTILINIFAFVCLSIIAIFLSSLGKTERSIIFIALIYLYANMFLNQMFFRLDQDWFKWLQYITPAGCVVRLNDIILNTHNHFTWSSDWLLFVSPIGQAIIASILIKKYFRWY